ncbi:ULP PROTEASE domain-containing protein [Citrus sinensis]|nr:ULP PROTEASE domain-containing protein [Citrus sinensis]
MRTLRPSRARGRGLARASCARLARGKPSERELRAGKQLARLASLARACRTKIAMVRTLMLAMVRILMLWFAGNISVDRPVQQSRNFFEILMGNASMGWLGDEHIHTYYRLISEKQRRFPNALPQRVFLKQLWNNGSCDVNSLQYGNNLSSYMDGREDLMSKPFTDVDMIFIPVNLGGDHWVLARADLRARRMRIYDLLVTFREDKTYLRKFKPLQVVFPQWLQNVGFYNIRSELQSADPWKVRIVKDVPQQSPGSGDCSVFMLMFTMYLMFGLKLDFDSSHGHYFRKKITVDIFTGDIAL